MNSTNLEKYTDWYIFAGMSKSERTRAHIIEATAPLFNAKGFEGTSLADLCKATGLTKGALYGNFDNKEDLAVAAFYHAIGKMRSEGKQQMDRQVTNKGKLGAMLAFFARYVLSPPVPGGCPLLNTAVEADDHRPQMRKYVAEELERSVRAIAELLEKGRRAGEFTSNFKARDIAMFFFCAIEGAIMFSRVSSSDEAMRMVSRNIRTTLDQL